MRIAVFLPNWIGDVVMATPAINSLWESLVGGSLVAVGRPYVAGVVDGSPWFDAYVPADRNRWWSVARQLRDLDCKLAILFPNSLRSALTARLAGIPRVIGYNRYLRKPFLSDSLEPDRDANGRIAVRPVLESYNRLVEQLGVAPTRQMRLFTTPRDEDAGDEIWYQFGLTRFSEVIAFNPGAAFGAAKHWPTRHFAELARRLIDERGAGVLVLCGPAERNLAREIQLLANRSNVFTLAESKLSIGLTKSLIRRSDLLVTTDSGPRHFAAAFRRPVVTLFGPTHIEWTETWHDAAVHLQREVACGPCQKRVCPLDHRCMNELLPEEVLSAADRLLAGYRRVRLAG